MNMDKKKRGNRLQTIYGFRRGIILLLCTLSSWTMMQSLTVIAEHALKYISTVVLLFNYLYIFYKNAFKISKS